MASSRGPKKSLGQHWLKDPDILADIAEAAELTSDDVVLEIGPGLGTLTSRLLARANSVIAVEFDADLARKLPGQFPGKKLTVVNQDILQFDLNQLPKSYKVVANVPYYITSKIVEKLMTAENKPSIAVLLVQKEVAERIAAEAGNMSVLSVSVQIFTKRKKLRSSLSGGLGIDKIVAEELLKNAGISPDARAEDLAITDWRRLLKEWRAR